MSDKIVTGRSEKTVDWDKVDQLLMAGCTGTQIAPNFNMHHDTFYRKVEEKFGVSFTAYSGSKKDQGDALLLSKQLDKALKGDNTMMIWLGKQRLGQKENHESSKQVPPEFEAQLNALLSMIALLQQQLAERNKADIKSIIEQ